MPKQSGGVQWEEVIRIIQESDTVFKNSPAFKRTIASAAPRNDVPSMQVNSWICCL